MIRNFFIVAWRVFKTNIIYNAVNAAGVSVAIAASLMILLYVEHESSYDSFQKNASRVFLLYSRLKPGADTIEFPLMNYSTAPVIASREPLVEDMLRLHRPYKQPVVQNPLSPDKIFAEPDFLFADSNFFSFFSFTLKQGNPATALNKPFTLIISERAAEKYFGKENPVGKILKTDSAYSFEITGIAENPPTNSIFQFDFIASLSSKLSMKGGESILAQSGISYGDFQTFFLMREHGDEKKFLTDIRKLATEDKPLQGIAAVQYLISLQDIHLHAKFGEASRTKYLSIFLYSALLILLSAIINYISLTSAKASSRLKEIGVRKVLGAKRLLIAKQFYTESAVYISAAFLCGLLIFFSTKNIFFNLLGIAIDNSFAFNKESILLFCAVLLGSVAAAATYPAVILSAHKPAAVLYGRQRITDKNLVQKIFVTIQFAIAFIVMVNSFFINKQLRYIRHTDTGVCRHNILMVPFSKTLYNNFFALKEDIKKVPGVTAIATAKRPFYKESEEVAATQKETSNDISLPVLTVDTGFINLLQLKWQAPSDKTNFFSENNVFINQEAVKELNLPKDPLNEPVVINGTEYTVGGVLKDFNYESLNNKIRGLAVFVKNDTAAGWGNKSGGCLLIKMNDGADIPALIQAVHTIYSSYDKATPFSFIFMDDSFNELNKAEQRLSYLIRIFMFVSVCIALFGLFAMATFTVKERIKEISIRKVLGAGSVKIAVSLTKDFLKPVSIALITGIPLSLFIINNWMQNFAYHISANAWTFILPAFTIIISAVSVTAALTYKAARLNPVKNLRSE